MSSNNINNNPYGFFLSPQIPAPEAISDDERDAPNGSSQNLNCNTPPRALSVNTPASSPEKKIAYASLDELRALHLSQGFGNNSNWSKAQISQQLEFNPEIEKIWCMRESIFMYPYFQKNAAPFVALEKSYQIPKENDSEAEEIHSEFSETERELSDVDTESSEDEPQQLEDEPQQLEDEPQQLEDEPQQLEAVKKQKLEGPEGAKSPAEPKTPSKLEKKTIEGVLFLEQAKLINIAKNYAPNLDPEVQKILNTSELLSTAQIRRLKQYITARDICFIWNTIEGSIKYRTFMNKKYSVKFPLHFETGVAADKIDTFIARAEVIKSWIKTHKAIVGNLTSLDISYSNITDISSLADCTGLIDLNLEGNYVTDLSPLAGCTNLRTLNVKHNTLLARLPQSMQFKGLGSNLNRNSLSIKK